MPKHLVRAEMKGVTALIYVAHVYLYVDLFLVYRVVCKVICICLLTEFSTADKLHKMSSRWSVLQRVSSALKSETDELPEEWQRLPEAELTLLQGHTYFYKSLCRPKDGTERFRTDLEKISTGQMT